MPITAAHIRTALTGYLHAHSEDEDGLAPALELLDTGADVTSRKEFRGHATAGAILVGPDSRVLHIHHLALDKWLLPGGHLEAGDTTLREAALRELAEETGIPASSVTSDGDLPIHIDVHPIPANEAKGEAAHQHIDFRYLFRTAVDVGEIQAEEVGDASWRGLDALHSGALRDRVAARLG